MSRKENKEGAKGRRRPVFSQVSERIRKEGNWGDGGFGRGKGSVGFGYVGGTLLMGKGRGIGKTSGKSSTWEYFCHNGSSIHVESAGGEKRKKDHQDSTKGSIRKNAQRRKRDVKRRIEPRDNWPCVFNQFRL